MAFLENVPLRFAVIGGGRMGEAMVGGWIASERGVAAAVSAADVTVADPGEERRAYLTKRYGLACVSDASEVEGADVVVLAVKPQVIMGVLEAMAKMPAFAGGTEGPLFVSIAAGVPTSRIEGALPEGSRVVRVMPNTPLLAGKGASVVAGGAQATAEDAAYVRDLFACMGFAALVDEDDIDAVGAVSGSGPAYVARMIEALRDAGAAQGLDASLAERLAIETIEGTCRLIRTTGQTPEEARIAVCSPGGTTLAALAAMDEAGFMQVFAKGVEAAVRRSKELAAC